MGNVSRTANLRLNLSSMKCAVMLRYESTARDIQQSMEHGGIHTSFYLLPGLIHSWNDFFRKIFATGYIACIVDP